MTQTEEFITIYLSLSPEQQEALEAKTKELLNN
jgi:hypothetical protein